MRRILLLLAVAMGACLAMGTSSFAEYESGSEESLPPGEGTNSGAAEGLYGGGSLESNQASNVEEYEEETTGDAKHVKAEKNKEAGRSAVLKKAKEEISEELSDIDEDLSHAAKKLAKIDLKGKEAREILAELCEDRDYVYDCAILDPTGKLVTIEPEGVRSYEGTDISSEAAVKKVLATKRPVLSDVFQCLDGTNRIDFEYPIISNKGEFLGAISMLVNHSALLESIIAPVVQGKPYSIWVMQTDGTVIYDPDPVQVNKNLFTDPMYADFDSVISFAKQAAEMPSGASSYDFYKKGLNDKTIVKKDTVWDTVSLYGTDWRIIVTKIIENKPAPASGAKQ